MGNDARQRAWQYQGTQGERLLLLALAEHIQDGRHTCWPAIETLAGMAGVSARQTQRLLRSLEDAGAIVTQIGRGRKHTTIYGLLIGLSDDDQKGVIQDIKGDIAVSPIGDGKGDIPGIKGDIKHDIAMSPLIQEKVTSGAQKVTFSAIKGDIAMSPEPKGTEKRTERDTHVAQSSFFATVAEACRIDLKLCTDRQKGQIAQTVKKLTKVGKTPEEIPKVLDYWYANDWRGKKGDAPRPDQLIEVWQPAMTHEEHTNGHRNGKHIRPGAGQHSERGKLSEADLDKPF